MMMRSIPRNVEPVLPLEDHQAWSAPRAAESMQWVRGLKLTRGSRVRKQHGKSQRLCKTVLPVEENNRKSRRAYHCRTRLSELELLDVKPRTFLEREAVGRLTARDYDRRAGAFRL